MPPRSPPQPLVPRRSADGFGLAANGELGGWGSAVGEWRRVVDHTELCAVERLVTEVVSDLQLQYALDRGQGGRLDG